MLQLTQLCFLIRPATLCPERNQCSVRWGQAGQCGPKWRFKATRLHNTKIDTVFTSGLCFSKENSYGGKQYHMTTWPALTVMVQLINWHGSVYPDLSPTALFTEYSCVFHACHLDTPRPAGLSSKTCSQSHSSVSWKWAYIVKMLNCAGKCHSFFVLFCFFRNLYFSYFIYPRRCYTTASHTVWYFTSVWQLYFLTCISCVGLWKAGHPYWLSLSP